MTRMTSTRSSARLLVLSAVGFLAVVAPLAADAILAAQQRPAGGTPGGTPGAPPVATAVATNIDWRLLGGLDYETGKVTDTLKKLDGTKVRVPGFIVPLDDADQEGAEFLLVPYYGACVHTPPPPPNQMAFVHMLGRQTVKLALFDAIWMEGTLRITNYDSPYGQVGFQIEGLTMKPYTGR